MNKKRILVCDDDDAQYENFVSMAGESCQIFRSYHYQHVVEDLKKNAPIQLLILDLGFSRDEYKGHECIPDVLQYDNNIKIIIYSAILSDLDHQPEALEIALKLMDTAQVVGFLSPSESPAKIQFDIHKALGTPNWMRKGEDAVWLLHISDPQFGGGGLLGSPHALATEIGDSIQNFVSMSQSPDESWRRQFPSIGIITGDVTEHARPKEFEMASVFVESLSGLIADRRPEMRGLLGSDSVHNVIVIPGNHDVNWDILFAKNLSRRKTSAGDESRMEFKDGPSHCNPELDFLSRFSWIPFCEMRVGHPDKKEAWAWDPGYHVINLKDDLGIIFVCLNSSLWGVNQHEHNAFIPKDVWLSIQAKLRTEDPNKTAARILLVHHSLDYDLDPRDRLKLGESSGGREELINKISESCNFCAVFTGHIHKLAAVELDTDREKRKLIHIGAGTVRSSDVDPDKGRQFNLVRIGDLRVEDNKYSSLIVYTFRWDGAKFGLHNAFEGGMKPWKPFPLLY